MSQSVSAWIKTSSFAEERVIIISIAPYQLLLSPGRKFRESQSSLVAAREPGSLLLEERLLPLHWHQTAVPSGWLFFLVGVTESMPSLLNFSVLFPEKPKGHFFG